MLVLTQALAVGPKRWVAAHARPCCFKIESCEVRGGRRRKADAAERGEDSTQQHHRPGEPCVLQLTDA